MLVGDLNAEESEACLSRVYYRFDRNRNEGGGFIYVREDILSGELKILNTPEHIESIFIEINLIKTEWIFCGCYHPPSQSDQYFFKNIV